MFDSLLDAFKEYLDSRKVLDIVLSQNSSANVQSYLDVVEYKKYNLELIFNNYIQTFLDRRDLDR